MLEMMRKHAGNWIIKILLGAIALAFALSWGVYNYGEQAQRVALTVNGEPITQSQLRQEQARLSEQARAQFGKQFDQLSGLLNLEERAKEMLVERILLFQAANQIGITVAQSEIQAKIMSIPAFQRDGRFDYGLYQRLLARNRLTVEEFEASQRNELIMNKLSALVAGSAQVTPLEVDQALTMELEQLKAVYQVFSPGDYKDSVKAAPADLEKYYKANKGRYLVPEKLVLQYIVFPSSDQRDKVKIHEDDVKDAYELNRGKYARPERVHARHILIKLPENADKAQDAEAKKKAKEILALAQKPGADFAKLAKEHSQGPSAAEGGDLGYFQRGRMVPEFEKLAFSLGKGKVGICKTRFGYHVVKVEDHQKAQTTPLEKVRAEIVEGLTERQAKELAAAAAERAFDLGAAGTPAKELAQKLKVDLVTAPPTELGKEIEGLKGLKGLKQAVDGIHPGQVLPIMSFDGGSVLAYLEKKIPETYKPLKEVEADVKASVLEAKADQAAQKAAADYLKKLAAEKDAVAALKASDKAKETGWLSRGASVKDLDASTSLVSALFDRPVPKPLLTKPVRVAKGFAAAAVLERKEPTAETLQEKRKDFTQALLDQKRQQELRRFLLDLKTRAEIKVPAS